MSRKKNYSRSSKASGVRICALSGVELSDAPRDCRRDTRRARIRELYRRVPRVDHGRYSPARLKAGFEFMALAGDQDDLEV